MGQSTAALIPGNNAAIDIFEVLRVRDEVSNLKLVPSGVENFVYIIFNWVSDADTRNLSVFFNGDCSCDYENVTQDPHTIISFGYWGSAVEIMEVILDELGGFIRVNDCGPEPDCDWIPYEEYKKDAPIRYVLDKMSADEYNTLKEHFLKGK